jgi:hypothetical protein
MAPEYEDIDGNGARKFMVREFRFWCLGDVVQRPSIVPVFDDEPSQVFESLSILLY